MTHYFEMVFICNVDFPNYFKCNANYARHYSPGHWKVFSNRKNIYHLEHQLTSEQIHSYLVFLHYKIRCKCQTVIFLFSSFSVFHLEFLDTCWKNVNSSDEMPYLYLAKDRCNAEKYICLPMQRGASKYTNSNVMVWCHLLYKAV